MTEFNEIDDKKLVTVINGVETECDILFTVDSEDLDETLVAYTDNSTNENGELNIFVSKYSIYNPKELVAITDPEEKALMDKTIKEIMTQYK